MFSSEWGEAVCEVRWKMRRRLLEGFLAACIFAAVPCPPIRNHTSGAGDLANLGLEGRYLESSAAIQAGGAGPPSAPCPLFVPGYGATLLHDAGNTWTPLSSASPQRLYSPWGFSPNIRPWSEEAGRFCATPQSRWSWSATFGWRCGPSRERVGPRPPSA